MEVDTSAGHIHSKQWPRGSGERSQSRCGSLWRGALAMLGVTMGHPKKVEHVEGCKIDGFSLLVGGDWNMFYFPI